MEWPAHLPIVEGGGVSRWYQSQVVYNNLGLEEI